MCYPGMQSQCHQDIYDGILQSTAAADLPENTSKFNTEARKDHRRKVLDLQVFLLDPCFISLFLRRC